MLGKNSYVWAALPRPRPQVWHSFAPQNHLLRNHLAGWLIVKKTLALTQGSRSLVVGRLSWFVSADTRECLPSRRVGNDVPLLWKFSQTPISPTGKPVGDIACGVAQNRRPITKGTTPSMATAA